jgi:hypothetical protein
MTATTTAVMPENGSVPVIDAICGRAGCGRPLLAGERGSPAGSAATSAAGGTTTPCAAGPRPRHRSPKTGPRAELGKLTQLLAEASRLG